MAFLADDPKTDQPPDPERYRQPTPVRGSEYRLVWLLGAVSEAPVFGTRNERMAMIAGAQRGRVSRGQVLAAGIASTTIDRYIATKRLLIVHRAVF